MRKTKGMTLINVGIILFVGGRSIIEGGVIILRVNASRTQRLDKVTIAITRKTTGKIFSSCVRNYRNMGVALYKNLRSTSIL